MATRYAVVCAVVLTLNGCAGLARGPVEVVTEEYALVAEEMAARAQELMRKRHTPGVSLALVDGQQVVWAQGFGYADVAANRPATPETVYHAGALAAPMTALALMRMAEEGLVDIDAPLTTYVPEFAIQSHFPDAAPIILRDMLSHHSGIPGDYMKGQFCTDPAPPSALVAVMKDEYLVAPPGTVFAYSNVAYGILGYLIEQVTGQDFDAYMRQAVFEPLDMTTASFALDRSTLRRLAKGYRKGEEQVQLPCRDPAADGLYASVLDMAQVAKMILAGGKAGTEPFLEPQTVEEMLRAQNEDVAYDNGFGVGLAWHLTWPDLAYMGRMAWYSGWASNSYGFMALALDHGLAAVAMANSNAANLVLRDLVKEVLQLAVAVKSGIDPPAPPEEVDLEIPQELLETVPGHYASMIGLVTIERVREGLRLKAHGHTADLILEPDGRFAFRYRLAGLLPIQLAMFEDYSFSFYSVGDIELTMFHEDPWGSVGQKIDPVPIPEAWLGRAGRYEVANRGSDVHCMESARLECKDGLLVMSIKVPLVTDKSMQSVVLPLDDRDAVAAGMGRHQGERVNIVVVDGEERLRYSGYEFRRVRKPRRPANQP